MSLLLCGEIPGTYRSERLCDIETAARLERLPNWKQPAAVANSIRQRSIGKLPICGSQIRRILRTQITVTLPPLWQAAVKDARAAKRNKWRGPAQREGGRLCRLRVSLRAACQSGTQRPRFFLALEIATQVAAGLAAVHKQKLVHRDIKPSNIIVSLGGSGAVTAKVIDLGLAKSLDEPGAQTTISTP